MLRRKIYDELLTWKKKSKHKCLLIKGQHNVGKTFIIRRFGEENYAHFIYLDLSVDVESHMAFESNLDVDNILNILSLIRGVNEFIPHETLIFFDEIQDCPRARQSLKQFTIDGRFDVIASGSLLDAVDKKENGIASIIPVGYEEHLMMYALDFEEYLWARNVDQKIINELRNDIHKQQPIDPVYYDIFDKLTNSRIMVLYRLSVLSSDVPEASWAYPSRQGISGAFHEASWACPL